MSHPSSTQETPPSPPMFTNAQLKALLLPLLLEQFLSVSMGLADTVMVSGVGEAAVSSVSLGRQPKCPDHPDIICSGYRRCCGCQPVSWTEG